MGRVIEQTSFEALEPGTYHARLGAVAVEDGDYGEQVVMRWDLLEDGLEDRSVKAWANPKLTGGKKPSKLYGWVAALMFGGRPLPDGFALDLDQLLDKEALLVVDVKPDSGFNKITSILPLRRNGGKPTPAPVPAGRLADPATCPDCGALAGKPNSACSSGRHPGPVVVNEGPGLPDQPPAWLDGDGAES